MPDATPSHVASTEPTPQEHLLLRVLSASTPPDVIYHYTTAAGLLGMCKSKRMWATEIRYLNDSREFRYTLDLVQGHLKTLESVVASSQEVQLVNSWKESLDVAHRFPLYIASFSEHGDQLSQWRAYGKGSGYSVGFAPGVLTQAFQQSAHKSMLLKCVYKVSEQLAQLDYATSYLLRRFTAGLIPPAPDHAAYQAGYEVAFYGHILLLAGCFKDPAFEEEAEWRLVVRQRNTSHMVDGRRFRDAGRTLAPYLEMPLDLPGVGLRLDHVIVGPTPHMDTAVAAVKGLLEQESVTDDGVEKSAIPYRDW